MSLNIPTAESPSLRATPGGGMSSFVANPNFSSSTLSLAVSQHPSVKHTSRSRSKSTILPRSLLHSGAPSTSRAAPPSSFKEGIKNPDSSYVTAADRTGGRHDFEDSDGEGEGDETGDDSAEVEDALQSGDDDDHDHGPTERELELERRNDLLQRQLEQVKLLVLGLDKRLSDREELLGKTIERAEQANRGLDAKLRELDLNQA